MFALSQFRGPDYLGASHILVDRISVFITILPVCPVASYYLEFSHRRPIVLLVFSNFFPSNIKLYLVHPLFLSTSLTADHITAGCFAFIREARSTPDHAPLG